MDSLGFFYREEGDDPRVVERSHQLGFTLEALQSRRILGHVGREYFQGYPTLETGVLGLVDLTHPTRTELVQNPVM